PGIMVVQGRRPFLSCPSDRRTAAVVQSRKRALPYLQAAHREMWKPVWRGSSGCAYSRCERHAFDFATVSEPQLHRPDHACWRIVREKFAVHSIEFFDMSNVSQNCIYPHYTFKR